MKAAHPVKACIHCERVQPVSSFYKNSHMADGHVNVCITCKRAVVMKRNAEPATISGLLRTWGKVG